MPTSRTPTSRTRRRPGGSWRRPGGGGRSAERPREGSPWPGACWSWESRAVARTSPRLPVGARGRDRDGA
eukprot:9790282-Alexandrium_andersonii.AAC.1